LSLGAINNKEYYYCIPTTIVQLPSNIQNVTSLLQNKMLWDAT